MVGGGWSIGILKFHFGQTDATCTKPNHMCGRKMALIIVLRELLIIATRKRMSKLTGKDGEKVDDERSLIVVHNQACQAMT